MPPRNYRNSNRRSRLPRLLLGGFGLMTLMVVGIVGTLWLAGVPLNPFAKAEAVDDPFMVRIPINAQPIPAYTRVDRLQLLNPATGGLMVQRVPPAATVGMSIVGIDELGSHVESRVESIKNLNDEVVFVVTGGAEVRQANAFSLGGAILNVNAIIGRVVKADKRAGLGFQESTFFPQGTPEGLAGATPAGMRAITLDATKLTGVHSLGAGDQIDLLANVPIDEKGEMSEVELIAQSAKVLRPVYVRNEVSTSASLMNGKTMQNTPKYEVAIAVSADDVIRLQNAINRQLAITCIAHSMKPLVDGQTETVATMASEVRVPVTVRPIFAYDVVTRDAFVSPATRSLKTESISKQEADRIGAITSLGDALGSIVRQDIPAGRYLRHADLLNGPPRTQSPVSESLEATRSDSIIAADGTRFVSMLQNEPVIQTAPAATAVGDRPAISTFIPPGMKSFAIPWNRLYGAEHVQIGDQVDLLVSYPLQRLTTVTERDTKIDPSGNVEISEREYETIDTRNTERTTEESFGNRGEPWFVATEAIVIGPIGFPAPAPAQRALLNDNGLANSRGSRDRSGVTPDGPPIIVAVPDQDAENVAAALVTNEALFSIAIHSSSSQSRPGMKEIALCPVNIEAYELFDESVWNNNRRRIMTRLVDEADPRFLSAITVTQIEDFYGSTLARAKTRWDYFQFEDFLSPETRPGVASAVQLGYTVALVDESKVEGLAGFTTEERVTIVLRTVERLPENILYARFNRQFPQGIVVVRDARIIRRSVQGIVAVELPDCEATTLQAAIAYADEQAKNNQTGSNAETNSSSTRLVALAQPRLGNLQPSVAVQGLSNVQSFDALESVQLTEVIINARRTVYAFDTDAGRKMECVTCQ